MAMLLMCLSMITGAVALAVTASFAEKKVPLLGVILLAISIAMALVAGTKTESNCSNASVINKGL